MIACHNISAAYGESTVLQHIQFSAKQGECIAVLGQNGSGKTTLLRVLSGVLALDATAKKQGALVQLAGQDIQTLSPKQRAKLVAVVPQKLDFLPPITVQDMVLLGRYPHISWWGAYGKQDYAIAQAVMEEVDICALSARYLSDVSGGELQRVLLARALAQQSPILLLDEPAAALDLARMQDIFQILERKCAQGALVLAVMHDVNMAALYASRILALKQGQLIFNGTVADVFTQQNLRHIYDMDVHVFAHPVLGVPQVCPLKKNNEEIHDAYTP